MGLSGTYFPDCRLQFGCGQSIDLPGADVQHLRGFGCGQHLTHDHPPYQAKEDACLVAALLCGSSLTPSISPDSSSSADSFVNAEVCAEVTRCLPVRLKLGLAKRAKCHLLVFA